MNRVERTFVYVFRIVVVACIYVVLARLALNFTLPDGHTALFWPSAGMALGVLVVFGPSILPGILLGAVLTNYPDGLPFNTAFGVGLAGTVEALVAWLFLGGWQFNPSFERLSDWVKLTIIGLISAALGAIIGTMVLVAGKIIPPEHLFHSVIWWAMGDILGITLVTPLCLPLLLAFLSNRRPRPTLEAGVCVIATAILGQVAFTGWLADVLPVPVRGFWLLPFLVWSGLRLGTVTTSIMTVLTLVQSLVGYNLHTGYFGAQGGFASLVNIWGFFTLYQVVGMVLNITIRQIKRSEKDILAERTLLQTLMNTIPDRIFYKNRDSVYLGGNYAFERNFGLSPGTVKGRTDFDLMDSRTAEMFRHDDAQTMTSGKAHSNEIWITSPTGERVLLETIKTPFEGADGTVQGVICISRDITARATNELVLQDLTRLHATLANSIRATLRSETEQEIYNEVTRILVESGGFSVAMISAIGKDGDMIPMSLSSDGTLHSDGSFAPTVPGKPDDSTPAIIIPLLAVRDSSESEGMGSSATFLIMRGGKSRSMLTLHHGRSNAFTGPMMELLNTLVSDLGLKLDAFDAEIERYRAEGALVEANQRYTGLVERVPSGVFRLRVDTQGRKSFDYLSRRTAAFVGSTVDDCMNNPNLMFEQIQPPDDDALDRVIAESRANLEPFTITCRFSGAPDPRWVTIEAVPMLDAATGDTIWDAMATDVTDRMVAEMRFRLLANVFETTREGIIVTGPDTVIVEVNDAFTHITGYAREDAIGKKAKILKSDQHPPEFYTHLWQSVTDHGHWSGEIWNRRKDGEMFPEWLSISQIIDVQGRPTHFVGIFSDISQIKQHERQLEHIAHHDALTGIPNRVLLADRMDQALFHCRRDGKLLGVCYLDLDGFKPVNDTMGHDAGDRVLIEIANRLCKTVRGGDTVARLGGDEFVILLQGMEKPEEVIIALHRLLETISQPVIVVGKSFVITASIGCTIFPHDDEDADTLLRHADQAMYVAKQSGKNQYQIYDAKRDVRTREQAKSVKRIRQALVHGEFELYYQPKVLMRTGVVIGAEALIRWRHPDHGLLSPAQFLPLIAHTDLEELIGEWVISAALDQLQIWSAQGLQLELSINIAAAHLQSPRFVTSLTHQLAKRPPLEPGSLQIEVLETAAFEDFVRVEAIIEACRAMGISFALDDFGTGYSSLTYLRSLPVETLKIDQSFVRDLLIDQGDRAIVQGIMSLASAFGLETVAEGVETRQHFDVLVQMGCEIGQGYGIAKPMPASEFPGQLTVNYKADSTRSMDLA